jgi:glycosyltransferase involved in cell wall biosynthesis
MITGYCLKDILCNYITRGLIWLSVSLANIKFADVVWTTTKILAEKIRPYNKNVEVIKNAIDPNEKQFAYEDLSLKFDTFFYSGGSTHLKDLKLLGNAFR